MLPETATPSVLASESDPRKFLIAALNGTALYVVAYYLVGGLHQVAQVATSRFFGLRGTWNPSRVVYTMADGEWWPTAIIGAHGAGPAVALLVGVAAFAWYWKSARAHRGQFKLLLLWVSLHGCNAVFGALLADTFTHSGFWYVADWLLRLGNVVDVLLALLAGMVQLALGYFGAVAFLQAHDSRTVMRHENRQRMVASTLVVPWVVGGTFIALTKLPYFTIHEGLHLLIMGLLVIPLALGCLNELFAETVKRPQPTRVAWGLLGLAVVVALVWRLALSPPVAFG